MQRLFIFGFVFLVVPAHATLQQMMQERHYFYPELQSVYDVVDDSRYNEPLGQVALEGRISLRRPVSGRGLFEVNAGTTLFALSTNDLDSVRFYYGEVLFGPFFGIDATRWTVGIMGGPSWRSMTSKNRSLGYTALAMMNLEFRFARDLDGRSSLVGSLGLIPEVFTLSERTEFRAKLGMATLMENAHPAEVYLQYRGVSGEVGSSSVGLGISYGL